MPVGRRYALLAGSVIIVLAAVYTLYYRLGGPDKDTARLKIGVIAYRGDDTFISNMMNSLRTVVDDFEKSTGEQLYLTISDAQNSQSIQNGQIERFISLGYDVLCVNLVDRTNATYIIDKAMEADVPVVFFNREPVQADMQKWNRLYYVGTDAPMNGTLEGQIVVDAYQKDPYRLDKNGDGILQYIMIEGEFRHQDAVLRTEGSVKTITDAGIKVEKLDGGIADWERNRASALAKEYFEQYGSQIELIICNNDDMALGVVDMVKDLGIGFNNIVGIDGTPQGLEAVQNGDMLGTVFIDYHAQAQLIFDISYALMTGADPGDIADIDEYNCVRAPMRTITAENVNEIIEN